MLNILKIVKWRRFVQYAAGVTGQFDAGMEQQTSHILFKYSVQFDGVYRFLAKFIVQHKLASF